MARAILGDWDAAKGRFWKVYPHEYAAALRQQAEDQAASKADQAAVAEYDAEGKDALEELRVLAEKARPCCCSTHPSSLDRGHHPVCC